MTIEPALALPLAWFIALSLGLAALHKILRQQDFLVALDGYGITPRGLGPLIAYALAAVEAACALLLIVPAFVVTGAIVAMAIFAAYALVMAQAIARGRSGIDCGCYFGRQPSGLGWRLVLRNLLLIAIAAIVAVPLSRAPNLYEILSGAGAGLALLLIQESARTVVANREWIRAIRGAS